MIISGWAEKNCQYRINHLRKDDKINLYKSGNVLNYFVPSLLFFSFTVIDNLQTE